MQILVDFEAVFIPDSMAVNYQGCPSTRNVEIIAGEFTVSTSTTDAAKAIGFLDHRFISALVKEMTAHIVLDTTAVPLSHKFDKNLVTILLMPFQVCLWIKIHEGIRNKKSISTQILGGTAVGSQFQPHMEYRNLIMVQRYLRV